MKKAYITLCSSERFLRGTLTMYESLNETGTAIPLVVFLPKKTPIKVKELLQAYAKKCEANTCKLLIYETSEEIICNGGEKSDNFNKMMWKRWSGTFDKLLVFGFTQYDKLVFIDSDMMILGNLEELFDCPHMSACCDGLYDMKNLNSGLMVIEPSGDKERMVRMMKIVDRMSKDEQARGDQDVIREMYPDWKDEKNLHLPLVYNALIDELARHSYRLGYHLGGGENAIKIVHFIGPDKPWFKGKGLKWKIYNFVYRKKTCRPGEKKYKNDIVKKVFKKYDYFFKIADNKLKKLGIKIYELGK